MSYHNDPYRVDYLKIYPCLKERPDVLEVLKKSDRKMRYMEVDLKSEQRRKNAENSKTQEALDNALEQQPIDEDSAKGLILQLAAEQYAALGDEEYETNRLRHLFSAFECVAELNADLLKSTVSEVLVTRQNVKLRLKNGQVIERSDLQ